MQLLKATLDGTVIEITEMTVEITREAYIAAVVAASGQDSGYVCVGGETLDSSDHTERQMNIIASSGELLIDNFPGRK